LEPSHAERPACSVGNENEIGACPCCVSLSTSSPFGGYKKQKGEALGAAVSVRLFFVARQMSFQDSRRRGHKELPDIDRFNVIVFLLSSRSH